jgi:membrane protein DedA with SNARE-associated domain
MRHLVEQYGLPFLFLVVGLESAGAWLPGETALILAAIYASQHHFGGIVPVIVVAAAAAILGDNLGYWLARVGGRRLLNRWGPTRRLAERVLPPAERFFRRHGGKTVFFGRFFAGLRVTAAWVAGISHMPWWRFFFWNAAGGIVWAVGIGLVAYYAGHAAADAINRWGLYGAIAIVALAVAAFFGLRLLKRRVVDAET